MINSHHKIDSFRERLKTDFPSLQISSIKIIGSGWDHDAIEVNGDSIFRIPKGNFDFSRASPVVVYETGHWSYFTVSCLSLFHFQRKSPRFGASDWENESLSEVIRLY